MATGGRHSQPGSASYLEDLLSHLSEQLCHFTQARMEMADLYEKMHALASQKSIASEELVAPLEAVLHKYSSKWVETQCRGMEGVCLTSVACRQVIRRQQLQDTWASCRSPRGGATCGVMLKLRFTCLLKGKAESADANSPQFIII